MRVCKLSNRNFIPAVLGDKVNPRSLIMKVLCKNLQWHELEGVLNITLKLRLNTDMRLKRQQRSP